MQCLDDQLGHFARLPPNAAASTETELENAVNKVADKSNSQHQPSAVKDKAMFHRSATPRLHCPFWAVVFLALSITSVHSVALHPLPSLSSFELESAASFSPLQPVLALNSTSAVHTTREQVHNILAPLIDDHHDDDVDDAEHQDVHQNSRSKREAPHKQTGHNEISQTNTQKKPGNKNKMCYKKALHRCGRTFVNSYKFVRVKKNKDNDILVAQCALRTAFFDCLKARANECNKEKQPIEENPFREDRDEIRSKRANDAARSQNRRAKKEKNENKLRNRLAETIWDSRVCIFRNSLKFSPGPL